jgi:transcriptional regulator with XRE-family HTH domain
MKKTNFDSYLDKKLKDPAFAKRFAKADEAWDVAMQIAAARKQAGLSQKELAARLKTSQQQVSRLESPSYRGHSLQTLERVANVLGAKVRITFEPHRNPSRSPQQVSNSKKEEKVIRVYLSPVALCVGGSTVKIR